MSEKAIACIKCGDFGSLILSTANADYSCEVCGEWQDAILGSGWEIIGYTKDKTSLCGDHIVPIGECGCKI